MLAFTNHDHSLRPFRLSDNEAEIAQLLTDGWYPVHEDGSIIVVTRLPDGTWLLDGYMIKDAIDKAPLPLLDRLASLFTDEEWQTMEDSRNQ